VPSVHIAVPASLALVLSLALAGGAWAQAPLQSSLAPTEQTRPQDSAQAALRAGDETLARDRADRAAAARDAAKASWARTFARLGWTTETKGPAR